MTESGPFSPSRGLRVRGRSRCCWCERGPRAQSGSGLLPLGAHRRLWDQPAPVTSMWTRGVSFCTTSPAPHGPHGHFHRVRTGTSPGNGSETARPQPQAGLSVRLLKAPERACASSWGTCLLPPPLSLSLPLCSSFSPPPPPLPRLPFCLDPPVFPSPDYGRTPARQPRAGVRVGGESLLKEKGSWCP